MNALVIAPPSNELAPSRQSASAGEVGRAFDERIGLLLRAAMAPYTVNATRQVAISKEQQRTIVETESDLFDALASIKIETSQFAMHLPDQWRKRLFSQLDSLLDYEEWDESDQLPRHGSFATLLRLYLLISPDVGPGLGLASNGNFLAAWTKNADRLTVECMPNDQVRWSLSRLRDGMRERAAGETNILRLQDVLVPYQASYWFS